MLFPLYNRYTSIYILGFITIVKQVFSVINIVKVRFLNKTKDAFLTYSLILYIGRYIATTFNIE